MFRFDYFLRNNLIINYFLKNNLIFGKKTFFFRFFLESF